MLNVKFRKLYYRPRYIQKKLRHCVIWNVIVAPPQAAPEMIPLVPMDISGIVLQNEMCSIGVTPENIVDLSCVVLRRSMPSTTTLSEEDSVDNINCLDDFMIDYPASRKKITSFLKPPHL